MATTAGSWRVEPDGVRSVLDDVSESGRSIAGALMPLGPAVAGSGAAADGLGDGTVCTAGVPSAGLISAALSALMEHVSPGLETIASRIPAASDGLRQATQAVIDGDATMAADVQASMLAVLHPGSSVRSRWAR